MSVKNIIVVSDLHCGCRGGLMTREPFQLQDGGTYSPSATQLAIRDAWDEFWGTWVPEVTKGEPFDLVINGDAVEGVHHHAVSQISHNVEDHVNLAYEVLKDPVTNAESAYLIRGTEAHVGQSGHLEEALARRLGVKGTRTQKSRWELFYSLGGKLLHFTHHIGGGGAASSTSPTKRELTAAWFDAAQTAQKPVSYVVRSHRHSYDEHRWASESGYVGGVITPAWQAKGGYAYKASCRNATTQLGGILIRQGSHDDLYVRAFVRFLKRDA